jgi:hypothetical protein
LVGSQSGVIEYWGNQGNTAAFSYTHITAKDLAAPDGVQVHIPTRDNTAGVGRPATPPKNKRAA